MTYRQRAIALAKDAHRTMLLTGNCPNGLFLAESPDASSQWVWAGTLEGPDNILQRQWVVELTDHGTHSAAYNADG